MSGILKGLLIVLSRSAETDYTLDVDMQQKTRQFKSRDILAVLQFFLLVDPHFSNMFEPVEYYAPKQKSRGQFCKPTSVAVFKERREVCLFLVIGMLAFVPH